MKGIIDQVFKGTYLLTPEGQLYERELTEQIHSIIELLNCSNGMAPPIEELIKQAGVCGQSIGFVSGFKYATQLLCECDLLGGSCNGIG